jgi:hypothetical protein
VSTGDAPSNGHKTTAGRARDLRDRPLFRIAAFAVVLLIAFLATKSCARHDDNVTQEEAIAIASKEVGFKPDKVQIRYVPRGFPPVYFWAVSLYTLKEGNPDRVTVLFVNPTTGDVLSP